MATAPASPRPDGTVISLFAYENPAVDSLLEQWRDSARPIVLLVPEGRISGAIARFFGLPYSRPVPCRTRQPARPRTRVHRPATTTRCYGPATSTSCAAKTPSCAPNGRPPFVWHIYPQADDAHLPKLDAALAHYAEQLPAAARDALARFWHAWNGVGKPDWADFQRHRAVLERRAAEWATNWRPLATSPEIWPNSQKLS